MKYLRPIIAFVFVAIVLPVIANEQHRVGDIVAMRPCGLMIVTGVRPNQAHVNPLPSNEYSCQYAGWQNNTSLQQVSDTPPGDYAIGGTVFLNPTTFYAETYAFEIIGFTALGNLVVKSINHTWFYAYDILTPDRAPPTELTPRAGLYFDDVAGACGLRWEATSVQGHALVRDYLNRHHSTAVADLHPHVNRGLTGFPLRSEVILRNEADRTVWIVEGSDGRNRLMVRDPATNNCRVVMAAQARRFAE